jgi:hypothetical protein
MEQAAAPSAQRRSTDAVVAGAGPRQPADHPTHVTREQAAPQGPAGSTNPPSAIEARLADANAPRMRGHVSTRTRHGQAKREAY